MIGEAAKRDALGCMPKALAIDQELLRNDVRLYRKSVVSDSVSEVFLPANNRGFLIGVSMTPDHRRSIYRGSARADHDFAPGSLYLRNLGEDYHAEIHGSFDFVLVELSPMHVRLVAEEAGVRMFGGLTEHAAYDDPVLSNLVRALAPSLEQPDMAHGLFIDQLSMAIATHLVHRYGGHGEPALPANALLTHRLEMRAKEFLDANMARDVSVGEVAESCSMSRGYFIRAFRETTGVTPYRWLLSRRVEKAKELVLQTDLPLAEIAAACGFSDQSHLNRHFTRLVGHTPGQLRRIARN